MKAMILFCVTLFVSLTGFAEQRSPLTKIDADSAKMTVTAGDQDSDQAAAYLDNSGLKEYIEMMRNDPNSRLAKEIAKIEKENCDETAKNPGDFIGNCGRIELSDSVETSFSRGGWMEGDMSRSFFVGFRQLGTGHFLEMSSIVTVNMAAVSSRDENQNFTGTIVKTFTLENISAMPK